MVRKGAGEYIFPERKTGCTRNGIATDRRRGHASTEMERSSAVSSDGIRIGTEMVPRRSEGHG